MTSSEIRARPVVAMSFSAINILRSSIIHCRVLSTAPLRVGENIRFNGFLNTLKSSLCSYNKTRVVFHHVATFAKHFPSISYCTYFKKRHAQFCLFCYFHNCPSFDQQIFRTIFSPYKLVKYHRQLYLHYALLFGKSVHILRKNEPLLNSQVVRQILCEIALQPYLGAKLLSIIACETLLRVA